MVDIDKKLLIGGIPELYKFYISGVRAHNFDFFSRESELHLF